MEVLDIFEGPDNLVVADYAKLAGKSRRWITYEIQARNLLSIQLGNKGQRVPVWQLNMFKRRLVQAVLKRLHRGVDTWDIYYALTRPCEELDGKSPIEALTSDNQQAMVEAVCRAVSEAATPVVEKRVPINRVAECMSEF
ncbi:hypothetical protein [Xanthomonas fragariae]|uniref:hypothetical protein n=1 Tax=Xanthomonas fragariae TaxID=48664 RepID=UPI0022AA75E4|nr:hypothetical protein [Xanthomonas fragariae]WAT14298.1 hypothetical protein OZ429_14810 [Xanthomonas fragariae]